MTTAGWLLGKPPRSEAPAASPQPIAGRAQTLDCGAASLYVICKLAAKETTLEDLRKLTKTSVVGTSLLNLNEAADCLGFKVVACQCSFERLAMQVGNQNCFAILQSPPGHFVAVIGSRGRDHLHVVDGDRGDRWLRNEDLQDGYRWEGTALFLTSP